MICAKRWLDVDVLSDRSIGEEKANRVRTMRNAVDRRGEATLIRQLPVEKLDYFVFLDW